MSADTPRERARRINEDLRFYDEHTKPEAQTIVYPENEALRFVISEQRKEIERLRAALEQLAANAPTAGTNTSKSDQMANFARYTLTHRWDT